MLVLTNSNAVTYFNAALSKLPTAFGVDGLVSPGKNSFTCSFALYIISLSARPSSCLRMSSFFTHFRFARGFPLNQFALIICAAARRYEFVAFHVDFTEMILQIVETFVTLVFHVAETQLMSKL